MLVPAPLWKNTMLICSVFLCVPQSIASGMKLKVSDTEAIFSDLEQPNVVVLPRRTRSTP
ncbi:hypothetical protein [Chitinimonas taiwanensis]|uniref:hypothetical protein n=1 Tax=Chitinimonas taiwanensis TaxID=240412 RepID=UPI0035B45025